ncbi:mitochondrial metal transporter [Vanrija albida]|uniref:Mitochondrial metal transporter n=1 Tax=Vanrija albida TaxID=181172 RepID=A0ABR3Q5I4_9TREE
MLLLRPALRAGALRARVLRPPVRSPLATIPLRLHSTKPPAGKAPAAADHDHEHDHEHHHSLFHSHSHDHAHGSEGAEQIINAFKTGKLDRGTKITLLGLGSNVALTVSKGLAGLFMNSASLLAEAGHSLSDLLGDFVTLATWRISRKPPNDRFPWGYAKFETCGTLAVSVILVGGAIGIGLHSYHLLLQVLIPYLESLPPDSLLHGLQAYLPSSVPSPLLELFHAHGVGDAHGHAHAVGEAHAHDHGAAAAGAGASGAILNPHAAWFALASVVIKEWLYQITNKVAKEEHSPVLKANALHHRADALTSLVALGSIVGSSLGGYSFLDPLGGIAVSFFILQQGLSLSKVATMELLDVGIDAKSQKSIEDIVDGLVDHHTLLGCRNVRGVRSGGQIVLDLTIVVPASMTVRDSHAVEQHVRDAIMAAKKETREVKIHVHGDDGVALPHAADPPATPPSPNGNNDFGRDGC